MLILTVAFFWKNDETIQGIKLLLNLIFKLQCVQHKSLFLVSVLTASIELLLIIDFNLLII